MLGLCLGHLVEQQALAPTDQRQWLIDSIRNSVQNAGVGYQIEPEALPGYQLNDEGGTVNLYSFVHATWTVLKLTVEQAREFAAKVTIVADAIENKDRILREQSSRLRHNGSAHPGR